MSGTKQRHPFVRLVLTLALAMLSLPLLQGPVSADVIGGFEVDGNQVTQGNIDWQTIGDVDVVKDPVGNPDASVFDGGDSEGDNDGAGSESPWGIGSPGTPSGKSDIGNILVSDYKLGGDTYAAFAWDRAGDTGTGRYYIELNQKASAGIMPNRTNGDFRIIVAINGSDLLQCVSVQTWNGQWGNSQPCGPATFKIVVNDADIADFFNSPNAPLEQNTFLEGVLNLSDFGLTTCPVSGFQSIHLRSQEGGENGDSSRLKDFGTGPVTIASDCGSLKIVKNVIGGNGTGEGAVFRISPNPTPGAPDNPPLFVTTGADGTFTVPEVEPGDYTVTELVPPAGYLLPIIATKNVTVPVGGPGVVEFNDLLGLVTFTKAYEGTPPSGQGATFKITRTHRWQYDGDPSGGLDAPVLTALGNPTSFNVTDNGSGDDNGELGRIRVPGLLGGRYTIEEVSAPPGWEPAPGAPVLFDIGATDDEPLRSVHLNADGPRTFFNVLLPIAIKIVKTESVPGVPEDTTFLPGVTFELFEADDVPGFGAGDTLVSSQVTDANGEILWSGLNWQKDYWLREIKKPGYEIGLVPNPKLIDLDQSDPPTDANTVITVPVDNPREELSIDLTKVGDPDGALLNGGMFDLYRESNGTPGLQLGEDTQVGGSQTLVNGFLAFSQADYQIPWGYTYYVYEAAAPALYDLMTPNPILVDATSSDSANITVHLNATDPRIPGHWTLTKESDPPSGSSVAPGDQITYTLTVHNDSQGKVDSAIVNDDLSQVLNNATIQEPLAGGLTLIGTTLTWDAGSLLPDETKSVSYTVVVNDGAFNKTLKNVATPANGGECVGDCETTHFTPHYVLSKSSDPASGSTVQADTDVTYTLRATNDSNAVLSGATVTDNLSNVLNNATIDAGALDPELSLAGNTLTWAIPDLGPGESVEVSYTVHINADAWGVTIGNVATPDGSGDCVEPGGCETTHLTPHWTLEKTSDPVSGSTVHAGTDVTYTLTAVNDSDADLSGASVTDDLSNVLNNATIDEGSLDPALSLAGTSLTWAVPDLGPGESAEVSYTVHINDDAWDVTIGNHATPDQPSGECVNACETEHLTPHYTLQKTSIPTSGSVVQPGDPVEYTLTVTNDSDAVIDAATVHDDLTDVLDNATILLPLDPSLSLVGTTLTWTVPTPLEPGESAQVSYTVTVNPSQWDVTLHNVATPGDEFGDCVGEGACDTTHTTPPVTTLVIKKVDLELLEDKPLGGATFTLWQDNEPLSDSSPATIGPEDTQLASAVSGVDGLAKFPELRPGHYLVKETVPPPGYGLLNVDTIAIEITEGPEGNFVAGGEMAPILFRDPGEGQLAIVAKRQFELNAANEWVESDGLVQHGDLVKYVVTARATGPKIFHDVLVTDYIPGYNPDDEISTDKAELVPNSAKCTGTLQCTVTVGEDGLVTWHAGTVSNAEGTVEMVVRFPELPQPIPFDENNEFVSVLWNVGFLEWDEVITDQITPVPVPRALAVSRTAARSAARAETLPLAHHTLVSNEVVIRAVVTTEVLPTEDEAPPAALPETGTPLEVELFGLLGALAVMAGGVLMALARRSRALPHPRVG